MEKLYTKYEQYDDIEVAFFEPGIMINIEENINNTDILKEVFSKNNLYMTKNNMILMSNVTDKVLQYISNWYYKLLTTSYNKDFSKPDRIYKHMTIFVKDKNGIAGGPLYKLSPFIISQEKREVIFEII